MVRDGPLLRQRSKLAYRDRGAQPGDSTLQPLLTNRPWIEWLLYGLLLTAIFGPAVADDNAVIGADVDLRGTLWYFWWFGDALLGGESTEITNLFCYPYGVDIHAQTGGNFLDAALSVPFQWVFGTPGYYAVFVMALFAANALAFRSLLRTIGVGAGARVAGTLFWMVNPFVFHELIWGRPTQAFMLFSLLAIRSFWLLHREPRLRHAAWTGVWVGLQGLTYWYAGYFLAFVLGWMALCLGRSTAAKVGVGKLAGLYGAAAAVCGLLLARAVGRILSKADSGSIPMDSIASGSWLVPDTLANYVGGFILGYQVTEGHGYPMLQSWLWAPLLLAALAAGQRRLLWLGAVVVTLAVATGPEWVVGDTLFRMPQYMALYHVLPFFERLWFPYRILGFTFIALSVAGALLIDKHIRLRWVLPAALVLFGLGVAESVRLKAIPLMTTDVTAPTVADRIREEGGPVINVPFDSGDVSVLLQVAHGQPILSGMGENSAYFKPQEHLDRMENNTFLRFLDEIVLEREEELAFAASDKAAIEAQGFRWVVLFREQVLATQTRFYNDAAEADAPTMSFEQMRFKTAFDVQRAISEHLGPALMVDGQYVLWDLQNPQTTPCCDNEYALLWREASNPHFEVLERMGRSLTNKMQPPAEETLDPNVVPPEVVPMPPPGPGQPPRGPGPAPSTPRR